MNCTHTIGQVSAVYYLDGYCPLCLRAEVERMRQTINDQAQEIERCHRELAEVARLRIENATLRRALELKP